MIVGCERTLAAGSVSAQQCREAAVAQIDAITKSAMRTIDEYTTRRRDLHVETHGGYFVCASRHGTDDRKGRCVRDAAVSLPGSLPEARGPTCPQWTPLRDPAQAPATASTDPSASAPATT